MKPGDWALGIMFFVVLAKFTGFDLMVVNAYCWVMQNLNGWF